MKSACSATVILASFCAIPARAADCNQNNIEDEYDILPSVRIPVGKDFPLGDSPVSLTSDDFDSDGLADIATAGSKVSVLFSRGQGEFLEVVNYELPPERGNPYITSADVDNDNDSDLIITTSENNVWLMKSAADRSFSPAESIAVIEFPYKANAKDLDNDSHIDLCIAHINPESISILWGRGDGTFLIGSEIPLGYPESITINDFDGDGDNDLALGNGAAVNPVISIIRNRGNRKFSAAENFSADVSRSIQSVDLDRDGDTDLAAIDFGKIAVFWNEGNFVFTLGRTLVTEIRSCCDLRTGDFNNDKNIDFCMINTDPSNTRVNSLGIILNGGGGNFSSAAMYQLGKEPYDLTVNDFNNDGFADVAACNISTRDVSVLLSEGDGTFAGAVNFNTVRKGPNSAIARDFNNDGALDLAVTYYETQRTGDVTVSVFLRNERLTLSQANDYRIGGANSNSSPNYAAASDFNGDSYLDLAATFTGDERKEGGVSVLINRGNGEFLDAKDYPAGRHSQYLTVFDMDNDNDDDIAVANMRSEYVSLFLNDGTGTFAGPRDVWAGTNPQFIITDDFDSDGNDDLAIISEYSDITVLFNEGENFVPVAAAVGIREVYGTSLVSADIDNDGDADIAAGKNSIGNDSIALYMNRGDRTFLPQRELALSSYATSMRAADFDKNNTIDLAATTISEGAYILFQNSDGSFDSPQNYKTGLDENMPSFLETPDFDGNGYPDLLVTKPQTNSIVLLRNLTRPPKSLDKNQNGVPDECEGKVFLRGDATGDGNINITDAVNILNYLFLGGGEPICQDAADSDDSGVVNLTDAVFILNWLFLGGISPPAPGPDSCGADPTPDALECVEFFSC